MPREPARTRKTARQTVLPDARRKPRFAIGSVCTFARVPRIEELSPENAPPDWAIYGVPFDGGVTYRPGARFGPRAIREESQYIKRYSIEHDVDVCQALSIADAGDAAVSPFSCERSVGAQLDFARRIGDPDVTRLLALGGDHSIAYANIRVTWERTGKPRSGLPLVHFDSHLDTVDTVWDEKWSHASVFRRAIEEGYVDPSRMISIGIKGPLNTRDDLVFARDAGITVVTHERFRLEGQRLVRSFLRRIGSRSAYLSFDIDCIDPAFAPGTGTPVCGGFSSAEAIAIVRSLRGLNVVGADVVEMLPDRDVSGITALLASHIAMEVLALAAVRASVSTSARPRNSRRISR
ncbi:MAG: agmatinase [Phycisphaerales bacterium]|nr:agmatinase [Phycisphaerales bacterium]